MTHEFPAFIRDLLASPPAAGEGVHHWLFQAARQLHAHLPATEIVSLLEDRVANCGRFVPRSEIINAVQNSLACAWRPNGRTSPSRPAPKWPPVNKEMREAIISAGGGLADLWELSPIRIEDSGAHPEEIVDRLFSGNPLLCCGKSQSKFDTKPREEWRGQLAGLQFIVPSPMTAQNGLTQAGKTSAHALSITGPRKFLVCEFDVGTLDDQASLLIHLAGRGPMVMVLHSGGKSLHGWFRAGGVPEQNLRRFFAYAVSLGADPPTWTRSQFVRLPDGTRDNGKRQTVYFLNPAVAGGAQ